MPDSGGATRLYYCSAGSTKTPLIISWLNPLIPVTGVISSICVGRGRDFYGGERNVETRALREALGGDAKLVGMFANGAMCE